MTEITFYRPMRRDGGIRIGLDLDGAALNEAFRDGNPDVSARI
jgi:hypothetical protein